MWTSVSQCVRGSLTILYFSITQDVWHLKHLLNYYMVCYTVIEASFFEAQLTIVIFLNSLQLLSGKSCILYLSSCCPHCNFRHCKRLGKVEAYPQLFQKLFACWTQTEDFYCGAPEIRRPHLPVLYTSYSLETWKPKNRSFETMLCDQNRSIYM